jgi:Flp pilus assembly pilin Flp
MVPAMQCLIAVIRAVASKEDGQDLLEYALLMALIAVGAILTVTGLGQTITNILWAPIVASNI